MRPVVGCSDFFSPHLIWIVKTPSGAPQLAKLHIFYILKFSLSRFSPAVYCMDLPLLKFPYTLFSVLSASSNFLFFLSFSFSFSFSFFLIQNQAIISYASLISLVRANHYFNTTHERIYPYLRNFWITQKILCFLTKFQSLIRISKWFY